MRRSKTTFASEAGRFVHLGVFTVLALLSVNHLVALPFLVAEAVHLWKKARRILSGALLCAAAVLLRMAGMAAAPPFAATAFAGVVTATAAERFTVRTDGGNVYVFHDGGFAVVPGDLVAVRGSLTDYEPRSVEHGFDYGRFLRSEGIAGAVFAAEVDVVGKRFVVGVLSHALKTYVEETFDGPAEAMVGLFVRGDAEALPEDLAAPSADLGISHLFAISGMHVGALALFLESLLRRLHASKGVQAGVISALLAIYVALTGFAVSLVRAVAVYVAAALNRVLRGPFSGTDLMAFVTVAVLLLNPFAIYAVGFQLSYLVAFTIVLGSDFFRRDDPLRKMLKIGLLANVAALPILLELNGSYSLASIPANLVFVAFVDGLAVPASFFVAFVPAAEWALDALGHAFFTAVAAAGAVDLSLAVNFASDGAKAVYWALAGWGMVRLATGRKIVWQGALAGLLACLGALFPEPPGVTTVRIFDVGQGDAAYIAGPGCALLVDTGKTDPYDTLLTHFRKENIRALDYVVLTHGDEDHAGEIADLDGGLALGEIVATADLCPTCRAGTRLVATGDELVCGPLVLTVLAAGDAGHNDGSIVLAGVIGTDVWLFLGDAGSAAENRIDFPDADVLKVGHHGSATATTERMLAQTTPALAVISVGRTNRYGHPEDAVLAKLAACGAAILRTDRLGTITFAYPPWGGRIVTSRSEDRVFENALNRIVRTGSWFLSPRRRDIMGTVIG